MFLASMKPEVPKTWLIVLAAMLWSIVGVLLCRLAFGWLWAVRWRWAEIFGATGILLAFIVYRFGFSRIALKNIDRLNLLAEKSCLFAFQAWKSYLIIAVMVTLGIVLRHSHLPRYYLAVVYLTIGGALILSSFHYYGCLWRVLIRKQPCLPSGDPPKPSSR